jgi:hypothetical protein
VGNSEIIFGIETIFNKRIDMIYVKLSLVQNEVDRIITDETSPGLARPKLLLQVRALLGIESC